MHKIKVSINGKEIPDIQEIWANASAGSYAPGIHLIFKCPLSITECIEDVLECSELSAEIQINKYIYICPPGTITKIETGLNGIYGYDPETFPDEFNPYKDYWRWDMEVRNQINSKHSYNSPNPPDPDILIKVLKAPEQKCLTE